MKSLAFPLVTVPTSSSPRRHSVAATMLKMLSECAEDSDPARTAGAMVVKGAKMVWKWLRAKFVSAESKTGAPSHDNSLLHIPEIVKGYQGHFRTSGVTWSKVELSEQVGRLPAIQVRKDRIDWACICANRAKELEDVPLAMSLIEQLLHEVLGEPGWFHAADLAFTVFDKCHGITTELLVEAQFGPRAANALRQRMPANPMNLYSIVTGNLSRGQCMRPALSTCDTVYCDLIYGRITEEKAREILG